MSARQPYSGLKRRLVIAFDLGTTFSGISFKLLLRPKYTSYDPNIPTAVLPPSKNIVSVFADFYRYLFDRVRTYICETNVSGDSIWRSVQGEIDFVLSHPNGWEGQQQSAMRKAAIMAGLVPDTPRGQERVSFVTEGESSFHYCISKGLMSEAIVMGRNVMIIDAGGGTVDLSAYNFTQASPPKIAEIAESACIFQGSVMVRQRAHAFLKGFFSIRCPNDVPVLIRPPEKLKSSRFGEKRYLDTICELFDQTAKKRFKGDADAMVKFSNMLADRDPSVGIRSGQIKLTRAQLCSFFDPSVDDIIKAIEAQKTAAGSEKISVRLSVTSPSLSELLARGWQTFCLVGGFAASEYLFSRLKDHVEEKGSNLFRPDEHTGKAVAEGAVSFYLDHYVSTRVAKLTYGTEGAIAYDPTKLSHLLRTDDAYTDLDGERYLPCAFYPIITKGTRVSVTTEFEEEFIKSSKKKGDLDHMRKEILCYRGDDVPEFIDESGMFLPATTEVLSTLCSITGVLSNVPTAVQHGPFGKYYNREYSVIITLGLTELKAYAGWTVKKKKKRGPASVMYDDDFAVTVAD
ncbi:hypothetical protein OF83DRAFT_1171359 [Amylostereum chailletii]|nr:hypothetical protein OF83DRAFT_1171359 [Amylostereum chailletii]